MLRFLLVWLCMVNINVLAQTSEPPFLKYMNHPWVDSVLNTLSTEQKIAQCIWIAGYSNRGVSHEVDVSDKIRKYGIGGIVFFQGTPEKQAELTNYYQKISRVPLLISIDAEWGLGMRLDNVEKFPFNMTLGAIRNDSLLYDMGKAVAEQFKRMGIHVNLAPVADINNNPLNPVINYRSFGENRENVASKSIMYTSGMQDNGIIASPKHFPGHGDTSTDSHLDLPLITHPISRLDSIELFPFLNLINEGAGAIMTAHLSLPSLDPTPNLPSTLSPLIINELLRKRMGFKGLVITDAMNMQGVTKYYGPGIADALALAAGNDIIEFVTDVDAAIKETLKLIKEKKLAESDLTIKCRKILAMKYWAGLNNPVTIKTTNLNEDLTPPSTKALIRKLYSNSLTVLKNDENIIPVRNIQSLKIATLSINRKEPGIFQNRISDYMPSTHFSIDPADRDSIPALLKKLNDFDLVVAGVFKTNQRPYNNYGVTKELISFLDELMNSRKVILTYFGNPYGLGRLEPAKKANGLILTYQENDYTEDLAAQLIFGGIGASGLLPVTINKDWPSCYGIITPGNLRLQYGFPESAGMSSEILTRKIDSLANLGLQAKAYPGCEVIAARKGIVVFHKTYGYHTYDNRIAVEKGDLYDLASVTKISTSLPGLMLLDTEDKFTPDNTLGHYLPYFKNSDKENILMRDLLTHQGGLTPFIRFWQSTIKNDSIFKKNILRHVPSQKFPYKIADKLYINRNYKQKMFSEIKKSKLGEKKYVYSDLTFIITPEIVESLAGERWYEYVTRNIYHRIGAHNLVFNPYRKYPLCRIAPTENDTFFRRQQLQGTVHDEGAAMLGGISGHAGLFASANDLLKLMELYRRMGEYGGEQVIDKNVMKEYTSVQFPENNNRRGLGFDKPLLNNQELEQKDTYPTRSATPESFGHSGYTGTFVWIDPVKEISYVFLCNRVFPTRNNNRLYDLNIRTEILQTIYDSIYD
jgi:beta-N-acetylhexosaminidase